MNLASGVLQPHEMMSARRMPGRPLALENGPAPSFRFRRLMYGRKPMLEDADGDFKIRVSLEMQMSIAGARTIFIWPRMCGRKTPISHPRKNFPNKICPD